MPQNRILVVDDDALQRWAMRKHLSSWGYEVFEAPDGQSGIDAFAAQMPDLVLLDLQLPDQTGVEVLRRIRSFDPHAVVIMVTAHGALQAAVEAFKLGLFDFLQKPIDFKSLGVTLRYGLEARHLRAEVARLRSSGCDRFAEKIVGDSPAVVETTRLLRKFAASGATTVLLTGESGTGKDLYARALHAESPRADGPFIPVNCAAIPETLMESELFGHEKGAFTDAHFLKKGVFELADGGTLYLDEIGEMRPALQPKLLRVLESFTFRRVGGARDLAVDVRIIAATNKNLHAAIEQGEFRRDLLYRLRVVELKLPALREHREDIPAIADHLLRQFAVRFRKPITRVSAPAAEAMLAYDWPGNVRELRNAIERAVILEETGELTLAHLPEELRASSAPPQAAADVGGITLPPGGVLLERLEESLVRPAIAHSNGNQTRAAQLLGISRHALRYKLKNLGLLS